MEIKSSKPITLSEAKGILDKRKEEGELGYEQSQAVDSSGKFAWTEPKKAEKALESIAKVEKISPEMAVKIVDVRPDNAATLKAILVKDRVELSEDGINDILKELI